MPFVQFDHKKIYYEIHGEGRPLIILNGIMMSCLSWRPLLPQLSKDRKVILLDFLDQGRSDRMEHEYDQHVQVKAVHCLMEALQLEQADLLGISYGGEIGLQFALAFPQAVNKLILFNTAAYTSPWLKDIGRGWIQAAHTKNPETFYNVTIPIIYSPIFYTAHIDWMNRRKQLLYSVFNEDFLAAMTRLTASAETYDMRHRLGEITADTLVVGTEYDFITPSFEQELIYNGISNAQYITIKACGHASMFEKPNEFVSIANGFLTQGERIKIV